MAAPDDWADHLQLRGLGIGAPLNSVFVVVDFSSCSHWLNVVAAGSGQQAWNFIFLASGLLLRLVCRKACRVGNLGLLVSMA